MRLQILYIALISSSPLLSLLFGYYGIVLFGYAGTATCEPDLETLLSLKTNPEIPVFCCFVGFFCGVLSG